MIDKHQPLDLSLLTKDLSEDDFMDPDFLDEELKRIGS